MLSPQSELLREKEIEYNLFKFLFCIFQVSTIKNINLERAKHEENMNRMVRNGYGFSKVYVVKEKSS